MKIQLDRHTLKKGDTRLAYWTSSGEGVWIVMLHGAGADHHSWDEVIEQLPDINCRFLLTDLRGHGLSRPNTEKITFQLLMQDLLDILEDAGVKKAIFVGQAVGGSMAQEMALSHIDMTEGIGIIGAPCISSKITGFEKFTLGAANFVVNRYSFEKLKTNTAYSNAGTVPGREYLDSCIDKMERDDLIDAINATSQSSPEDRNVVVNVPGFLLIGSRDSLSGSTRTYLLYKKTFPQLSVYNIAGAGSLVQFDTPKPVSEMIDRLYLRLYDPPAYERSMKQLEREIKKTRQEIMEKQRRAKEEATAQSRESLKSFFSFGKKKQD